MPIKASIRQLVWSRAGAQCSFPACGKYLILDAGGGDDAVMMGEVAHIVGDSTERGPRSDQPIPGGDRDAEANLMLLCVEHHTLIDKKSRTYTVEKLIGMKSAHERWVREQLTRSAPTAPTTRQLELVHSTMLAVDQLPRLVFTAPCTLLERDVWPKIRFPRSKEVLLPFVVREKKLIAFTNLAESQNPFVDAIDEVGAAEEHLVSDWLRDESLSQWLVALLNRALGKHASLLGLQFDKEHKRHFFPPVLTDEGKVTNREITYRPLNQSASTKLVAWNPVRKKTGEPKRHWIHLAAGLRLHRISPRQLILAIRPEHRFTTDGRNPLSPKGNGKRATSTKSRMYNHELLAEVQFWRSVLTRDQPRLILNLGTQSLVIDGQLLAADVQWPGVDDDAKPFANAEIEDDLFSMAAYAEALASMHPDGEIDDLELDDLAVIEEAADASDDAVSDDDWDANPNAQHEDARSANEG